MRNLVVVLGDQLDLESAAFDGFDPEQDRVWMAEVDEETTHVWAHKLRIAFFLSAMRHFREALRARGWTVEYTELPEDPARDRGPSHLELLVEDARRLGAARLIVVERNVAHDDVRRPLLQAADRGAGGRGGRDAVAVELERETHRGPECVVVVDQ